MNFIINIVKRKQLKKEKVEKMEQPSKTKETAEKIYISRDKKEFMKMANREFFTEADLRNNDMNYCIEFDNAISYSGEEALSKFLEKVVPDMQNELGIAFYGINPDNRNLLLDTMPKRRAILVIDNMLFCKEGVYRNKGKESINKACKIMLDILLEKEKPEEFKIEDYVVSCVDNPMIQFEYFVLNATEGELNRIGGLVDEADISVASYYLNEKAKVRLFEAIGEELTGLIKEDHVFMESPGLEDVFNACESIMKEIDDYWNSWMERCVRENYKGD